MTFSVVVPNFNAVRYLPSTLRSVFAQDGVETEVIVVDDGSDDGSADMVARDFPQVRLLRQENQGVATARNQGIAAATHPWIAFVDADDVWLPGKLRAQQQLLAARPEARLSCTAWHVWRSTAPEPDPAELQRFLEDADHADLWKGPDGWIYADLLLDVSVWTSTVVMHRSLIEEVGMFDPSLRIGEDLDLWLRASRVSPIARVSRPYALYRQHASNITRGPPTRNFQAEVIARALQRWGYDPPQGPKANRAAIDRTLANSWTNFGGSHFNAGNIQRARDAAWNSLRADPKMLSGWLLMAKTWAPGLSKAVRRAAGKSGPNRRPD